MNLVGTKNKENRIEWLKKTLASLPPGTRILDAGAGEGQYKKFCSHLSYVSQDFGKYDGAGDQIGLQKDKNWNQSNLDIISDITSIPEGDKSFDSIMCIEVLEHLPDPISALNELNRLLKDDGYLILTVPFCSLSHFTPYYFYSGFSPYFIKHYLEQNFEIIEIQYNGNFFEWLAQEVRRIPKVSLAYGRGKLPWYFKITEFMILRILDILSRYDVRSHELLSFGLHIVAKKKS